jgi:hypothetical protein
VYEDAAAIGVPALLLWGELDPIASGVEQQQFLQVLAHGRLEVYDGIGHELHWEDPERFAADVMAFARGVAMSRPVGALLTGATGGLGPAIARALAERDVTLALAGRREDAVHGLAAELSASGLVADLADRDQAAALIDQAEAAIGPVDVVVHNAAVDACARFDQVARG